MSPAGAQYRSKIKQDYNCMETTNDRLEKISHHHIRHQPFIDIRLQYKNNQPAGAQYRSKIKQDYI
jgi:hypothetical protein